MLNTIVTVSHFFQSHCNLLLSLLKLKHTIQVNLYLDDCCIEEKNYLITWLHYVRCKNTTH